MQNNQPKTPASSTVDAAMKAPHPGGSSDFGLNPEDAVSKVAEKIQHATNILIALSKDPNVDEISAAIALAFVLDQKKKHVTAIYSGQTPNALEFLRPEETFQKDISGLQDFIIALNKSKADHLIYQVEGDYVKILITPYKGQIKKEDLEYSYSDYNVDLVIVFNVNSGSEIDSALSEYGRIMHDAMAINITSSVPGRFADLEWSDPSKSSVCEMVYDLLGELEIDNTPQEVATALLTGILSATERFSNNRTKPTTMAVASKLMEAGADQQLISSNILKAETPAVAAENPFVTQSSSTTTETPAAPATPEAQGTPATQEIPEAPATPTIQENSEAPVAPVAPVTQETPASPAAQEAPAATAAAPEVPAVSQDSTEAPQLTPEQELERMFEQNQASQSQAPTSGSSLPGNPMVAASNVMDDLARLTDSMLSAESPAAPSVAPAAPVESITPNIPAVPEKPTTPSAPEVSVVTPTIPVAPENIPVAPENSPAPNIPVAPEKPTIPASPAQPQYIQPQPMQYQSVQPQPQQYQPVQPQPVQPQPEQIQPMPQMQAEYQPTPQFVQPATQPIQPAPQPAQPVFRPQPASNPEIYGHTIAEPVIDSGEDMSRLMDEALAEPSPIQNPIGYQGMINQFNYINQSLNQNATPNYPLAVGQQPVTNYQQGQNLATLSAPALPQMPQNQAYPNPEYSNVVPEYQTPAMPVLPEDPSQPAPQPIPQPAPQPVQPTPQPIPQPAPQPVQPTPQPIPQSAPQPVQPAQPQMQVPAQPTPGPIQSQQPMDSYIQTTPPATSTPIPDFLQPESFLPPAPAPVIIDQSAPPFMPPAMPTPQAIPQPTPQPAPQSIQPAQPQMQAPAQPIPAPAQPQMQAEVQPTPQPAQPQTTAAPAANPVKADPSAFHIPGSY